MKKTAPAGKKLPTPGNPVIVSAANDAYAELLDEMLESLQSRLHEYDLGILDLGLSPKSRNRIHARKENARIVDPGWRHRPADMSGQPAHKKASLAKPFLPEIFPGYSGYMWIDADIWFQDPFVVEHYIAAAEKSRGKGAVTFECHPCYRDVNCKPRFRIARKFTFLPVAVRMVSRKIYRVTHDMFGDEIARRCALTPTVNGGCFFMQANSPAWSAWQRWTLKANYRPFMKRDYFPDQPRLNVALQESNISLNAMPAHYNWIAGLALPVLERQSHLLLDPCGPHHKLYAIHLTGKTHSRTFDIRTTDGDCVRTSLRRSDFLRTIGGSAEKTFCAPDQARNR